MIALLIVHALVGSALFVSGGRLRERSFLVAALAPAATLVWLLADLGRVLDGKVLTEHVSWVPQLGLDIDLRLDGFAALMVLLIAGLGVAVCVYAAAYFRPTPGHEHDDPPAIGRYAGLLVLFAGAMLCVVLADNLLVLYTGWELTSVSSYLLIGNDHTNSRARAAALQALLITSAGGLAMLGGFVLIGQAAGTYRLSAIIAAPPSGTTVIVGVVLVLIGAFTKSAQYPFHSWLPGAMTAPTPISAYLHSATMVKAGIYLVGRLAPAFATTGPWRPLVLAVGGLTMVAGGLRALRQHDLKLLVAFGTVSQLGFLIILFGIGTPAATSAGCVMLLAHAVFKAALFMSVGTVDHHTGTRDLRKIPDLRAGWWPFVVVTSVCAASMAGLPLMVGFIGKEAAFESVQHAPFAANGVVLAVIVAGSVLTVAYTSRFLWGMFAPAARRGAPISEDAVGRPAGLLVGPIAALATITVWLGVAPSTIDHLISTATRSVAAASSGHLALWHGANLALALSGVAVAAGVALFLARRSVAPILRAGNRIPDGGRVFTVMLRWTNETATRVTAVTQNGSLPIYVGVTLLTAAVVPGVVLVAHAAWPGLPDLADNPAQVLLVAAVLSAALAAAITRRRFSAAVFLGATGYSMAGLFVVQGAPDLALTQVAIETLSTVLFVLVLRRLPDRFERTSTNARRVVRLAVSGLVGVTVFAFAIIARASRTATPVSDEMITQSLPEAHGRNVVNVILVDIRGFDTLGEITVLASAAIGAVALARAGRGRRRRRADAVETAP